MIPHRHVSFSRWHWLLIALLLGITLYICLKDLGAGYFENWDEAWYAEVTKQMLRNHNPIVLYWNGRVFLDKTPFNFWINAVSASIFGLNEFAIRLPSAISSIAVMMWVTCYALRRWGWLPAIGTYISLAGNHLFIWRARTGNLDAVVTLLIFAIFFVMVSRLRYRLPILGLLLAATYLQKASLVGYPLLILVLYEAIFGWKDIVRNLIGYVVCTMLFVGIVGVWLHLGNAQIGSEFAQYYLFRADQGVAHIGLQYLNSDYFWHAYYALQRRIFYLFLIGIFFLIAKIRKSENFALLAFALALLVQLSLTEKNNNWYLVPSAPYWALVVGYGLFEITQIVQRILKTRLLVAGVSLVLLVPIVYVGYKTLIVNIQAIIETRANSEEVASARVIRKESKDTDTILRLDYSYPVTIYYGDRVTFYHTTIDDGLTQSVQNNNIRWVVGKKEQVGKFVAFTQITPERTIPSGTELILQLPPHQID